MFSACKTSVSCLMLCAYLIALFNPLYAFCAYALNKHYISQSLCENKDTPKSNCEGQCYLAKRIVQTEESQTKARKPAAAKNNPDLEALYICQVCDTMLGTQHAAKRLMLANDAHLIFEPYADIFHPPRLNFILF